MTNRPFLTILVYPLFLLLPLILILRSHTQVEFLMVPGFSMRTLVGILAPVIGTLMTTLQNLDMTTTALFPPLNLSQFTFNEVTMTQGRGVKVTLIQSTCLQSPDEYLRPFVIICFPSDSCINRLVNVKLLGKGRRRVPCHPPAK